MLQFTGSRVVDCGLKLHSVTNDRTVFAGAAEDVATFAAENGGDWYACVMLSDGRGALRGPNLWGLAPSAKRVQLMLDVAVHLNRYLHHDGHWILAWKPHADELVAIWRDRDGDAQFPIDFSDRGDTLCDQPMTWFAEQADEAHRIWTERMRWVELGKGQTYRRAQGERAPSKPS